MTSKDGIYSLDVFSRKQPIAKNKFYFQKYSQQHVENWNEDENKTKKP